MEEMFDKIRISIASDEDIRNWSHGEVKKPETINYRTLKPEKDGLFCEKIFGPTKDWECHCGKYKRVRYKGIICDRCGVEITRKSVRRERMGHIELAAPIAHIWFFKGIPNRIALILNASPKALERVVYFAAYIITESKVPTIKVGDILSETEYITAREEYNSDDFKAETGAEALEKMLKRVDLESLRLEIKKELENASSGKVPKLLKRLETVESFIKSGNKPESMIKNVIPVIPPDLRPMVQLDGGRFATADLNDLYRRVINRNNRLKRLLDLKAPEIIVKNEKRMLQEAVDALLDNSKKGKPVTGADNRPLKSLSDILKGKQGRFRQNLLGKRVDYSGRSVIVVGPELKLYECGLPKAMAIELFKPYVMRELIKDGIALNIKSAKRMVEQHRPEVWGYLEKVIKDHPVLLNRAPTLHRLGIQAFQPVIVEGKALKLHPLVCAAFNADFDGDQMAVHVPLSPEAQAEARYLILSTNNLIKPKDGLPITVPGQDMILGAFYLTMADEMEESDIKKYYTDKDEAMLAYQNHDVTLHELIKLRIYDETGKSRIITTTVGRIIFNEGIPQDLGYVNREDEKTKYDYEIGFEVGKKQLEDIIDKCIERHGLERAAEMLDFMKSVGFKYSTIAGFTVSAYDMSVPDKKANIIKESEEQVDAIVENYKMGLLSDEDRYNATIKVWEEAKKKVQEAMKEGFNNENPIFIMMKSGARGTMGQLTQIIGMRGLMADTSGRAVEIPIKSSFVEGLDALEFFIAAHGARKGLSDTALRTADSGYLTRKLVSVAQDVIVTTDDCGTDEGVTVRAIYDGIKPVYTDTKPLESLEERLIGRYPLTDVKHPETNEVIAKHTEIMTEAIAKEIVKAGIEEVKVRSVMGCKLKHGVCKTCYGQSLANKGLINVGETIGVIAAQAIGEPGTQLTMRTFHGGGIAGGADVTQGLPRVEELLEARKPKGAGKITEIDGTVTIEYDEKGIELPKIIVTGKEETRMYLATQRILPHIEKAEKDEKGRIKKVHVKAGEPLTEGSLDPKEILAVNGVDGVYNYIVSEVQKAYRTQGVDINDKHIEIILRQMLRKVRITDPGDSEFYQSALVDVSDFENTNIKLVEEGKKPIEARQLILGITKASIATDSFLSAASFQETTRVLTDAAVKGKVDELVGLKENIIIGKLIPAGTGLNKYKDLSTNTKEQEEAIAKIKLERERLERLERQRLSESYENVEENQEVIESE